MKQSIYLVDDDPIVLRSLEFALRELECDFTAFEDPREALERIRTAPPAVLISDVNMPGMNGLALLHSVREAAPDVQILFVTGSAAIHQAVAAMKKGAYDFITKPFDPDEILSTVQRALEKAALIHENLELRDKLRKSRTPSFETGKSPAFRELLDGALQAAGSHATILILGESGTGKEVLAQYITANSPRAAQPFVTVNCAAIPENLIESELFGHKKGSFTGAHQDRKGKFQDAHTGTIFLDEIGELPLSMQAKLLRVLQEGEASPVGGQAQKVDVRILAATNKNLRKMASEGRFREDLYYRLNVIPLHIPPLRQRMEDLPAYIAFFIAKFCRKNQRETLPVSPEAMRILETYAWPGNVRELENAIERAVIMCLGAQILPKDLPRELSGDTDESGQIVLDRRLTLEEMEKIVIHNSLKRNHWDRTKTARELGIGVRTLYRKMNEIAEGSEPPGSAG